MADVPLPHPVMNAMLGDDWEDLFTSDQMHTHAAAVTAAKDAEISRLKHRIALHDPCNGRMTGEPPRYTPECVVFRERVRVLEDALRNDEQFLVDLEKAMGPFALPSGRTCTQLAAVRAALAARKGEA